jgi:bifunctional non-homologous end joining protein LigD
MAKPRPRVVRTAMPPYEPQFAVRALQPPEGDSWLHEINYAGYRAGCRVDGKTVSLLGRDGKDWASDFPEICKAALGLGVREALLDGEIVLFLPDGRTSLEELERVLERGTRRRVVYCAFDLLFAGGESFVRLPLEERKRELLRLVGGPHSRSRIRYSEHVVGRGAAVFEEACRLGLQGLVSKRADAAYTSGRSSAWVKTLCVPVTTAEAAEPVVPARTRTSKRVAIQETRESSSLTARPPVGGVSISHPDRLMFPDPAMTKLDLARFYERIADWILPHLAGRPLTLVRCPAGFGSPCHYMKHSKVWAPPALRRVSIQEKTKIGQYLIADTLPALISLVQMDILEIHTWNTRFEKVEYPDRMVFDIDPGEEAGWAAVAAAARMVRDLLRSVDLDSFPKTTGGKGLHVVVPLTPRADWRSCLEFARALAETMEAHDRSRFTTAFAKAGREHKILIDYLRNNRTNTSVAALSTRAREGAPVSMPLRWDEVIGAAKPPAWNIGTAEQRLRSLDTDPWQDYWMCRQRLTATATAALRALA